MNYRKYKLPLQSHWKVQESLRNCDPKMVSHTLKDTRTPFYLPIQEQEPGCVHGPS